MILLKKMNWLSRRGFSLLELMIVVGIIGIIAAIAVPAFTRYMKSAKTSEALSGLRKIYDGEVAYYDIDHMDPSGTRFPAQFTSAPPTHSTVPLGKKIKGNWDASEWGMLRVGLDGPSYYSFEAVASGIQLHSQFTARARGDLNGDTKTSLFERTGRIDTTSGDVLGGAGVFRSNELE
jgi:type IV pilus assembly protein PilA